MTWLHRGNQTLHTNLDTTAIASLLAAGWQVCTDPTHRHHMAVS